MHSFRRHALSATPLALAILLATPGIAHARRGFPLFIIISDNPILIILSLVLVAVWAYFRFFRE